MSAFDYYLNAFKYKYADFEGRATRSEYWYFTLFNTLIFIFVIPLLGIFFNPIFVFACIGIYFLFSFIPSMALLVRRLHDTGRSGLWYFISFIPFGVFVLIVFLCLESDPFQNQYGLNPHDAEQNYIEDDISRHLVD